MNRKMGAMNKLIQGLIIEIASIRLAIRCLILPLTCLWSRFDRHLMWHLNENAFGSARIGVYPTVNINTLTRIETKVHLASLPGESYNVNLFELLVLAILAARSHARQVFEFGTANGRTTRTLAMNALNATVYSLNLPLENDTGHKQNVPIGFEFHKTVESNRIVQLFGNSYLYDFQQYFGKCQLIFIDADHSKEAVANDSNVALNLIDKQSGIIIWHDALRYGVQRALPQLALNYGPIHLISGTNLAILCFQFGKIVSPTDWNPDKIIQDLI